jgi:hypothetical protein
MFYLETRNDSVAGSAEFLMDVSYGHAARFPSAIQMLESFTDKSRLGLIAENEVAIGHTSVLPEVPCLADLEVAAELG